MASAKNYLTNDSRNSNETIVICKRGDDRLDWNEQDDLADDAEALAAMSIAFGLQLGDVVKEVLPKAFQ